MQGAMLAYRGFWVKQGLEPWMCGFVHNIVVDSASIEVNRRARRAKTDRLDGEKRTLKLSLSSTQSNDRKGRGADASRQLMNDGCLSGRDTRATALGLERMTATGPGCVKTCVAPVS